MKRNKITEVDCDDLQELIHAIAGDKDAVKHLLDKQCVIPEDGFLRLDFSYTPKSGMSGYFMFTINGHGIQVTQYDDEDGDGKTVLSWEWQRKITKPRTKRRKP